MQNKLLVSILLCFCLSCNTSNEDKSNIELTNETSEVIFDKTKWMFKKGLEYPFRDQMLNNIVYNDTVRTLNKQEIIELLGKPDKTNNDHLYYTIAQKRLGFWPLHTKSMVIKLSEENTIDWIKIHK